LMNGEEDFPKLNEGDVVIDAIFGIGLSRCPQGWVKKLIQYLNRSETFILAIDIPSGLFANKALDDKNAVIEANHTLTFQSPKLVFFLPETAHFVSDYQILDIGLDQEFIEKAEPLAQLISQSE